MNTPQDLIGVTLEGKYVITDVLGEGAMGIVYRGFDDTNLNEVAIKVLQPCLASSEEVVTRFHREATAARRVDHEGAVRILGRGCEGGLHYLVMELLQGKSLADVLAQAGRLPEGRAARLVIQLCGALSVAHERGVVHRDIKPENIMVLEAGNQLGERVKLLDFGIAKRLAGAKRAGNIEDSFNLGDDTRYGALLGTPEYMSPEQCTGFDVGAQSDIYACGVLLYRMVTGDVPFGATDTHALEVCQRHLGEQPVPPRTHVPSLSPAMEAVILKALRKSPSQRQQSAVELADELAGVLARVEQIEMEPTRPVSLHELSLLDDDILDLTATLPFVRPLPPPLQASTITVPAAKLSPAPALAASACEELPTVLLPVAAPVAIATPVAVATPVAAAAPSPIQTSQRSTLPPRGSLPRYLSVVAFAAVIAAGLGSLFMVLGPMLAAR
jgi:serine/threonine-protein kinase